MSDAASRKYSAGDWEEVRSAFGSSMMVGIKLSALAENLDKSWPIGGSDETPGKYIDFSYEELLELPSMRNRPERVDLLIDILKETLSFDDPFGEMVAQVEEEAEKEDELAKAMAKLQIPGEYPISLTNLAPETKDFCANESIENIGQFIAFSQNMAKNIVIGGDYRTFLNSLAHTDEKTLTRFLPVRAGHKGLHLVDAVRLAMEAEAPHEILALARKYGARLPRDDDDTARRTDPNASARAEKRIRARTDDSLAWFEQDRKDLNGRLNRGESLDRLFVHLDNPAREVVGARILTSVLRGEDPSEESGGFFKGLFRKFRR